MTAIAIFVKTPGLSPVKSRLASGVGRQSAEECHRRCARAVAAVAHAAGIGPVYWAVAETAGMDHPLWQDLPRILQPEGNLGQRMQTVHDTLLQRHGRAVLLGADLPQLTAAPLQHSHAWLEEAPDRGVLGPSRDGGFWLVGGNRPLDPRTWQAPQYGHGPVLKQFVAASGPGIHWKMLAEQTDLDEATDLSTVARELAGLDRPHSAQRSLLHWLASISGSKPDSPP